MVASSNMRRQSDNATTERLMEIFGASPIPLSTRDVGFRLRQRPLRLPDFKLSGILREMLRDGKVEFKKGRWVMSSSTETIDVRSKVTTLPLSPAAISLLDWEPQHPPAAVFHQQYPDQQNDHRNLGTPDGYVLRQSVIP